MNIRMGKNVTALIVMQKYLRGRPHAVPAN
jgi:hypothetical protein